MPLTGGPGTPERPQVLVVGAGPCGLAAALMLARCGVPVRIIDRNAARSDKSKALAVHAGTLECLEETIGEELVRALIDAGRPTRAAWIHLNDRAPIAVDLSTIPSRFNFILNLAQSETERILEHQLRAMSVEVERLTELVELVQQDASVTAGIRRPSGETERVTTEFLIGCDGAHSTVRHLLDIPFQGSAYTGDFILGDVTLEWPWPYGSVQLFASERGIIAAFPLQGERHYRLIMVRQGAPVLAQQPDLTIDEFRAVLSELSAGRMTVTDAVWLTRFRVHQRIVRELKRGRVFLVGDAAHIHSPAGGQGMNIGIQDALNLGDKLARVLRQAAPITVLDDYERERLPVARQVVRGTDFVFRLAVMPETWLKRFLRATLLPHLVRSRFLQRRAIALMSEVAIARREIRRYSRTASTRGERRQRPANPGPQRGADIRRGPG